LVAAVAAGRAEAIGLRLPSATTWDELLAD
jgi:hypothetical protein